jgi:hypothetical protein
VNRHRFTEEFKARLRFVIQKHQRVEAAQRGEGRGSSWSKQEATDEAYINEEAAIDLLADHVFDAIEEIGRGAPMVTPDGGAIRTTELL